jgi:hypothetical protein
LHFVLRNVEPAVNLIYIFDVQNDDDAQKTDDQEEIADGGGVNFLLVADSTPSTVKLKVDDIKQYLTKYSSILESKMAKLLEGFVYLILVVLF